MTKTVLFITLALASIDSFAQKTKAVTEYGEEVILNDDKTWDYANVKQGYETRLDTLEFSKPVNSTFLIKSKRGKYGIWIDPQSIKFENKNIDETLTEYNFYNKSKEIGGAVIFERIEIPISTLVEIAKKNALKGGAVIVKEETRKINSKIVKMLQFESKVEGVPFFYQGYYYSDPNCSIQFLTFTYKNLVKENLPKMENILNGFTILE